MKGGARPGCITVSPDEASALTRTPINLLERLSPPTPRRPSASSQISNIGRPDLLASHFSVATMNSNPYEVVLNGSASRRPENLPAKRPNPPSGVLARAGKRRQMLKPRDRLVVRRRYQFEMPPPTMDPKMLLGDLSMSAYSAPHLTPMELDARPLTAPADPLFGLRVDLVDSALYDKPPLSVADQALLIEIEQDRPTGASVGPSKKQAPAQAPASWMRRMSYDEYTGKSSNSSRPLVNMKVTKDGKTILAKPQAKKVNVASAAAKSIERSFQLANKMPKHPDKRKQHLRPVSVVPVFPDFLSLGTDLIAAEFEKNANITHDSRVKDPELLEKSKEAMATISLAEDNKKFLACFTPTDEAMESIAEDESEGAGAGEKKLLYDWVQEYAIREGARKKDPSVPQRGCFALSVHAGPGGQRVATLGRIGTNWKLSRRQGNLPRLGKSRMRLTSTTLSKAAEGEEVKSTLESIEKTP